MPIFPIALRCMSQQLLDTQRQRRVLGNVDEGVGVSQEQRIRTSHPLMYSTRTDEHTKLSSIR